MLNFFSLLQPGRSNPADYQPELKERISDISDPAEYCLVYKDHKHQIILTKYYSGQYTLDGVSPTVLQQYGELFDPKRPFKFL